MAFELAVPQKQLALSPESFKGIYQERNIARFVRCAPKPSAFQRLARRSANGICSQTTAA